MKTAISIPDPVFQKAENLASRQGKSRSQLYTEALVAYLGEHDRETVTERLNEVLASLGNPEDRWVSEATSQALRKVDH